MTKYTLPPMRPELIVCLNAACGASERIGVHSHQERRYICHRCGRTFSETTGTLLYGLHHPAWLVIVVLTLLAFGCPVPAIVAAFALDERTVADWQQKAGSHARAVQAELVCAGQVDLGQVQADELYVKTQVGPVWMATAMCVFSRLFVWGAISAHRDERLLTQVITQVRAAARRGQAILFAVDGLASYPTTILKVFRDPVRSGRRGRPRFGDLAGCAYCASGQAPHRQNGHGDHAAGGLWQRAGRPGDHGGDASPAGGDQHRLHRAVECDLAHLDARFDPPEPHAGPRRSPAGGAAVLDGRRLQLLSWACQAAGNPGDGGGLDGSHLVGRGVDPIWRAAPPTPRYSVVLPILQCANNIEISHCTFYPYI